MASIFKHRRKRNSGLVFELLVRRVGSSMVEGDKASAEKAADIAKRYFSTGILHREKELFDAVVKSRGLSEQAARGVLEQVRAHALRSASSNDTLEKKKGQLIGEVHRAFGKGFFASHRVPSYRLLASIQTLLDRYQRHGDTDPTVAESVQRLQLEDVLVRYMTTDGEFAPTVSMPSREVDGLATLIASEKFEERYANVLSETQRRLLRSFMDAEASGDAGRLNEQLVIEQCKLHDRLKKSRALPCFDADRDMAQKMDEVLERVRKPMVGFDTEQIVEELMLFGKLADETEAQDE